MKPHKNPRLPTLATMHGADATAPSNVGVEVNSVASTAISVSELNRRVKGVLEANFELHWVRGELSNVVRAASGHWYFSLKDDAAQVRCVMFRQRAQSVSFTLENGLEVEVRALPSLYEARGDFQLGVETMRRAGLGALFEAFERLKRKLAGEGLFDEARKRPLPVFAQTLGIVTSSNAAALRDVLTTLRRRAPMIRIIIYPTSVQGADAPHEIAAAIGAATSRNEVDALLICRGGGAMEDLLAFNDEAVARAIFRLQTGTEIAVVSGVGHETDFTICDFVADMRAATPTAGAEMLSPDGPKLRSAIQLLEGKLRRHAFRLIFQHQQRLDFAARALVSPQERLEREREKLQRQQLRLVRAMNIQYGQRQLSFLNTKRHFNQSRPELQPYRRKFSEKTLALRRAVIAGFDQNRTALTHCSQALTLLNPHNVLTRGYAIVRVINKSANNGGAKFVTGIDMVHANDLIAIQLHDGDIQGVVSQSIPKTKSETGQEKSNVACDWPV